MSYTNGTTHYNLPLTTGSDKRDWSDTNQAFADVDAALYGAVQDTAQAELDIDALETRMDTAEQNISTNTGNIAGLDSRLTTAEGAITSQSAQITDTRQDLEDMICAFNEASATSTHAYTVGDYFIYNDVLYRAIQAIAIGDTIVPDTNCTTTNVTTEILSGNYGMITAYIEHNVTSTHAYAIGDYFIFGNTLYCATQAIANGGTIMPNTNCSATTVTTEIHDHILKFTHGSVAVTNISGSSSQTVNYDYSSIVPADGYIPVFARAYAGERALITIPVNINTGSHVIPIYVTNMSSSAVTSSMNVDVIWAKS